MELLDELAERRQTIRELAEKYEEIRQRMLSPPSATGTHHYSRTTESRTERLYSQADEVRGQIIDNLLRLIDLKMELSAAIEQVPNEAYKQLLFERYYQGKKWPQIAREKDVCIRSVFKIHSRAMKELETILSRKTMERGEGDDLR